MLQRAKADKHSAEAPAMREIFCRYIKRNGRIIYPRKAKAFHFYVKS